MGASLEFNVDAFALPPTYLQPPMSSKKLTLQQMLYR